MRNIFFSLTVMAGMVICTSLCAKVKMPAMFSDNMVLQRETSAPMWGTSDKGKTVKVKTSWDGRIYRACVQPDGRWSLSVETPKAGGPYIITVDDGDRTVFSNVMIGEVWLCSGQSNMEMPLNGWSWIYDYEKEIAAADYPGIRLLQAEHVTALVPQDEIAARNGGWETCTPESIEKFSATAYFFGRDILESCDVPVGLIHSSWGGTNIESWISAEALCRMEDFRDRVEWISSFSSKEDMRQRMEADGTADRSNDANLETTLYNAMIHPIVPYAIRGAIWYQGENNASRAYQYRDLFPLLINSWRQDWGYEFPFYFVQLASYMERKDTPSESSWAELREAQAMTLAVENTGMAVVIDKGDTYDIHPKDKATVGRRLALLARAETYGEEIMCSGPLFESYSIEGTKISVSFKYAEGLASSDGKPLKGFAIAGPDKVFHWADAVIDGCKVVVSSPDVKYPLAVRYAWADNPECNLVNASGLPASPFRTDGWTR
ncbi:MAG: sialate O-acetylesterase [Bacteroidales bacterium]|nr:sialate O-acetylesterase [Bacteroidales bacterium]